MTLARISLLAITIAALPLTVEAQEISAGVVRESGPDTIVSAAPGGTAPEIGGAISAGPIISDGDVGGGGWLELWASFDWFRIGGMTGALVIPSSRDSHDRFATPLAISAAAIVNLGDVDLDLRVRGGIWAGSTQEVKMTVGGFLGGGGFIDFHLGGGASFGVGLEVWGFLGAGSTWALAPTLTLTFGPPPAVPPTEISSP